MRKKAIDTHLIRSGLKAIPFTIVPESQTLFLAQQRFAGRSKGGESKQLETSTHGELFPASSMHDPFLRIGILF